MPVDIKSIFKKNNIKIEIARNQEKAQSILNRFLKERKIKSRNCVVKHLISPLETFNLKEVHFYRTKIIKTIAKKIGEIQAKNLGDRKVRELNDELNKLYKEKINWELREKELGGPNHHDATSKSYQYFGAARNLPEIKEFFELPKRDVQKIRPKTNRKIPIAYFGFSDDDSMI